MLYQLQLVSFRRRNALGWFLVNFWPFLAIFGHFWLFLVRFVSMFWTTEGLRILAHQWDQLESIEHNILVFWKPFLPGASLCSTPLKVIFWFEVWWFYLIKYHFSGNWIKNPNIYSQFCKNVTNIYDFSWLVWAPWRFRKRMTLVLTNSRILTWTVEIAVLNPK